MQKVIIAPPVPPFFPLSLTSDTILLVDRPHVVPRAAQIIMHTCRPFFFYPRVLPNCPCPLANDQRKRPTKQYLHGMIQYARCLIDKLFFPVVLNFHKKAKWPCILVLTFVAAGLVFVVVVFCAARARARFCQRQK